MPFEVQCVYCELLVVQNPVSREIEVPSVLRVPTAFMAAMPVLAFLLAWVNLAKPSRNASTLSGNLALSETAS